MLAQRASCSVMESVWQWQMSAKRVIDMIFPSESRGKEKEWPKTRILQTVRLTARDGKTDGSDFREVGETRKLLEH